MKLSTENIHIFLLILWVWICSIYRIKYSNPLKSIVSFYSEKNTHNSPTIAENKLIRKTVKGVKILSPLVRKHHKCLMEAMIVKGTLRKLGIESQLHLGVKKEDSEVSTHAWVSFEDNIIIGGPATGYEEFVRNGYIQD